MKLFFSLILLFLYIGVAHAAVNVNTASQAELESLQGIGPAKAKAIIEYRDKNGPYSSIDDLDKVDGIGPGTIKQFQDAVTFENETNIEAAAKE